MVTKTGSQSMYPNVRWDRREEELAMEQASNSVRKGKARRAIARPAGAATQREAKYVRHTKPKTISASSPALQPTRPYRLAKGLHSAQARP